MVKLFKEMREAFKQGMREQEKVIAVRREKAQDLMHLTDTLESLTGSRDINPPLRMAIRFMAVGVDPTDFETIGKMAEAYAMGKFAAEEFEPMTESAFQESLDKINETEGKK